MERATKIVIELLSKGMPQSEVAELTNNSPSAISQVAAKYQAQIAAGAADKELAQGNHSQKLDLLEGMLADKLVGMVALETDSMKVAKMLQMVNSSVRRDDGERGGSSDSTQITQKIVQLNLPQHIVQQVNIQTDTRNDVVAVDGRDLTPASMKSVNSMAGIEHGNSKGDLDEMVRQQAFDDILQVALPR